MKQIILSLLIICSVNQLSAQMKGIVYGAGENKKEPLYGAKLRLLKNNIGVVTGEEGKFELVLPKDLPDTLVITAMGYNSDTIIVDKKDRFISLDITLYSDQLLPEVIVEYRKSGHSISRLKTLHVEEIGAGELRKAACCNLSESFETNASVDVNITDAVSGAKKIQMMGLDGVYTQIQLENIPYLRGLESSFGLNSMPGTWIESIQITKGTGNVVNGYESMAGLVNLEVKKPTEMEKFYANAYGSIFGRAEVNLNAGHILSENWSTGWFAHASGVFSEIDNNNDGFRDLPMGQSAAFLNRWQFNGKKMEAQFGFNSYIDQKNGGQIASPGGDENVRYEVIIDSRHIDAFAKTGFFMKKPYNSIGIVYNLKYQQVDAGFGNKQFYGEEKRGYINAMFEGIFGTTDHKYKIGLNGLYIDMIQHQDSISSDRIEIVPGVFGEYTFTGMRFTGVLGARLDYHNLYDFQFSPRIHSKYTLTEKTDLRFTAGKGWRVPNYIIDNISLLASSRKWIALDLLQPEISWNSGGSVVQEFKLFKQKASLSVDYYFTWFENQLIVDRDTEGEIHFENQQGKSYSNSIQTELSFSILKNWDVRFAYKYLDVKAEYGGLMQQQVMIPKHRGFFNTGYITKNKRWEFNLTVSVFGESRLPTIDLSEVDITMSEVYPMVNAQITHVYKKWDFYIGGENLTNYRQKNAIIAPENPFGEKFDATMIWGPVMSTNIYAGLRYSLKRKKA